MSEQEQIEGLHQRAAENYLQGEFAEALESWRELLVLDPQDERAVEGIRLCELIVQQSSDGDDDSPFEDPISCASPEAPGERSDVDFDEIESILKASEESKGEPEADTDLAWDFSSIEAASEEGPDLSALNLDSPDAADDAGGFDFSALDLPDPAADGATGDLDVQAKVADLLAQASTSYDAGDLEGALTLLDRVFLVDPGNPAATALAVAFRNDIEERDDLEAGEGPPPDAVAAENLESIGLAGSTGYAGDGTNAADGQNAPLVDTPPELSRDDGELGLADETHWAPEASADVEAPEEAVVAPSARQGGNGKKLMIGAVVVAALAAAGFLGFRLMGPDGPVEPAPRIAPADVNAAPSPGAVADVPAVDVAAVPDPTPAVPVEDLASVMARAGAAFEAGDFSKAVVGYNEALQLAPDNVRAQRGLKSAAAAYQEQRVFVAKLESASDAFTRGDYREALRVFYRLPGTEGVARFDRFKANSWYNLAVGALRSGSCRDAKSHLSEAAALAPGDSAIARLSGLTASCATSQGNRAWYEDVQALALRQLGD